LKEFMRGITVCLALLCITTLVAYALYLGHDGLLLSGAIGTICLVAGAKVKAIRKVLGDKDE
jgi:hypothetical protein